MCRREQPTPIALAYWVELPANGTTSIDLRAEGSYPSWPMTQYDLVFSTFEVDQATATRSVLQTASVSPLGQAGVHIRMRARKSTGLRGRPRKTPTVTGWTEPALKNVRISLRAVRVPLSGSVSLGQWAGVTTVALGSVRTDATGRFRLEPQPFLHSGKYAILARSEARGGIAADWNCGPFF